MLDLPNGIVQAPLLTSEIKVKRFLTSFIWAFWMQVDMAARAAKRDALVVVEKNHLFLLDRSFSRSIPSIHRTWSNYFLARFFFPAESMLHPEEPNYDASWYRLFALAVKLETNSGTNGAGCPKKPNASFRGRTPLGCGATILVVGVSAPEFLALTWWTFHHNHRPRTEWEKENMHQAIDPDTVAPSLVATVYRLIRGQATQHAELCHSSPVAAIPPDHTESSTFANCISILHRAEHGRRNESFTDVFPSSYPLSLIIMILLRQWQLYADLLFFQLSYLLWSVKDSYCAFFCRIHYL